MPSWSWNFRHTKNSFHHLNVANLIGLEYIHPLDIPEKGEQCHLIPLPLFSFSF